MAWQTPKTNWGQPGQTVPGADDFNRIEENIKIIGRYDRAPGYGMAYGTNSKIITLNPAPTSYYEGMCFAFRNKVQNTGPVTINVNGMGAKAIKKPNGNDLPAGFLKADSIYTVRYNGTNFILQGSDSSGDATPDDVRAGKTFSSDAGPDQVGTLPENQGDNSALSSSISGNTLKLIAPRGIYDGIDDTVTIEDDDWIPENIRYGINLLGKVGTLRELKYVTGTVSIPGVSSDEPLSRSFSFPTVGMSYPVLVAIRNDRLTSPAGLYEVGFRTIRDLPLFNARAFWGSNQYVEVNSDGKGVTDVHTSSGFSVSKTIRYYIVGYD